MGFMDKIKNMFTEEVEEEEVKPIKREMRVEIPSPHIEKKEEPIKEVTVSESEALKKDEKFVFPVYFDDKDFDQISKPVREPEKKPVPPKRSLKKENAYAGHSPQIQPEERKKFRPSPIISPVYGVLDKNYSKDDIMTRSSSNSRMVYHNKKEVTVDDVRKKAFGTLEDDLETTLFGKASFMLPEEEEKVIEPVVEDKVETDDFSLFEDPFIVSPEPALDAVDHLLSNEGVHDDGVDMDFGNMINDELNKLVPEEDLMGINEVSEVHTMGEETHDENLTDSDLFNLIDTMYEKGDDV